MIRTALLIVAAVVLVLYLKSRRPTVVGGPASRPAPSPWAALGQLLGGALASTTSGAKPQADAVYGRVGNPAPGAVTAATNWSAASITEKAPDLYRAEQAPVTSAPAKDYQTEAYNNSYDDEP